MPSDNLSQLCFSANKRHKTSGPSNTTQKNRLVSLLQSHRVFIRSVVRRDQLHFDRSEVALFEMHSLHTCLSL